jgi:hypothetical protein
VASKNKVLPDSSSPWWCSTPAPPAGPWRRGSLQGISVQESSAGGASIRLDGAFSGSLFQG